MQTQEITETVKARYGAFAETGGQPEACCCASQQEAPASSFAVEHALYSREQLELVPDSARNLSRGCGNPTGFAGLRPGEVVADLGCGGGIDVILAADQVRPEGRVVGVDVAPTMIERARENVRTAGLSEHSVELREAELAATGLPDGIADVLISNCVINLCPDKDAVYAETFRLLRPGGRLAISDVVLTEPLPADLVARLQADWVGCLGGAIPEDAYLTILRHAGFTDIETVSTHPLAAAELAAMARCPGPEFTPPVADDDLTAAKDKVISIKFRAHKPLAH